MKIALFGVTQLVPGKKIVPDERLDKLKELLRPPKVTYIQVELIEEDKIKEADVIICLDSKRADLILLDLESLEERLNREIPENERQLLLRSKTELEKETFLNELNLSDEEKAILINLNFVTIKPILVVKEDKVAEKEQLIRQAYDLSGYISFFTYNEKELHSWSINKGTTAHEAVGCVHSDIQRGFIKAEVISSDEIIKSGGINQAKSKGALHLENKDYIVKDADLIKCRFNI